jgi:hypothetical protein
MSASFTQALAVSNDANGESTSWPTYRARTKCCATILLVNTRQDGTADTTSIATQATGNTGAHSTPAGHGAWTSWAHFGQPRTKKLTFALCAQQGENPAVFR